MKIRLTLFAAAALLGGCATTNMKSNEETDMITHSVFFKLNHPAGSAEEAAFLAEAQKLASVPGVGNFQILEETSPKNEFAYGLTMTFEDQAAYDAYNTHPDHVAFVQQIWLKEVAAFQEIDHVPFGE